MRTTTTRSNPLRRPQRPDAAPGPEDEVASDGGGKGGGSWSTARVLAEAERVVRRLQQLEARPWWRVSGRELDELDARLDVLRAHAADAARG